MASRLLDENNIHGWSELKCKVRTYQLKKKSEFEEGNHYIKLLKPFHSEPRIELHVTTHKMGANTVSFKLHKLLILY